MIWGQTTADRQHRERSWHRWFAWYPVVLQDGRTAWLQTVERIFIYDEGNWAGSSSRWEFRVNDQQQVKP